MHQRPWRLEPPVREQIVGIIRQRAERQREAAAGIARDLDVNVQANVLGAVARPALANPIVDMERHLAVLQDPQRELRHRPPAAHRVDPWGLLPPPQMDQSPRPSYVTSDDEEPGTGSISARTLVNVATNGEVLSYSFRTAVPTSMGLFVGKQSLGPELNYFEIELLSWPFVNVSIGVVGPKSLAQAAQVGSEANSVGYHVGQGSLYRGSPQPFPVGWSLCNVGDRIGCGVKFSGSGNDDRATVFFTRNGKELPGNGVNLNVSVPTDGFYPAVNVGKEGEEVALKLPCVKWIPEEEVMMLVDSAEEDWMRLHDVKLNGPVLEYVGQGKSHIDVGLAQAKTPICTRNHYFEIEIISPGSNCYIAIGLARKDYPKNRHPGWNKGSIAYHADDGKVFVGSGVGGPFGPRCHKGDIMGCGVLFPRNYECKSDSEEEIEQQGGGGDGSVSTGIAEGQSPKSDRDRILMFLHSDSGEDDDWWNDRNYTPDGVEVEIYFTRNGSVIGKKEIRIPKGGFYPTIGMMSCDEKVRVDLRPLSG